MPDFVHDGVTYYSPVELALDAIGGRWKMPILWRLREHARRYTELRTSLRHISDKVLSSQLRELEHDGLVERRVFAEVPARTEYRMTARGRRAVTVIEAVRAYGLDLMREHGLDVSPYGG